MNKILWYTVAEVSNPIFNATTLNDFTNLQLFLQQQSQILALNEAASSSIDYNNPVAISPDYATSTSIPPTPIRDGNGRSWSVIGRS
ncbi:unnamed protein product [Rhizophagus irregularis]|nr:unnamed protein product [Rhizophagus irregularis]